MVLRVQKRFFCICRWGEGFIKYVTIQFYVKLDFKVGWKKLKEVFSIAGTVKRADIKEDKDGKSRGMGTVTFEQAIEAVQAICILIYISALVMKLKKHNTTFFILAGGN